LWEVVGGSGDGVGGRFVVGDVAVLAPFLGGSPCASTVKKRIKATANVAKLTGVMKMVASAKLKFVEERLTAGKPFGVC
jgi:hypothetical protein